MTTPVDPSKSANKASNSDASPVPATLLLPSVAELLKQPNSADQPAVLAQTICRNLRSTGMAKWRLALMYDVSELEIDLAIRNSNGSLRNDNGIIRLAKPRV